MPGARALALSQAGWGFHEDGLNSGIAVASALGAPPPWTPRPLSPKVPMMHGLAIKGFERLAHKAVRTRPPQDTARQLLY